MGMAMNSGIGSQIGQAGLGQSPIQSQSAPQMGFGMPAQGYDPTIDPATGMPMQMPSGPQQGFGMPPGVLNQDPGPGGFQNPGAMPMPTAGQGGGKAGGMDLSQIGQIINQGVQGQPQPQPYMPAGGMPQQQPGPQMGFGMPAQGYGAAPQMAQPMQAAPVNRFAPPNAPGVRTAQPMPKPVAQPIRGPVINKPAVGNARPVVAKPTGRTYTTGLTARR
jgi:hypothetical protein